MRIFIRPGQTLEIGFMDADGFELDGRFDVAFTDTAITIDADLPDAIGREGRLYEERFDNESTEGVERKVVAVSDELPDTAVLVDLLSLVGIVARPDVVDAWTADQRFAAEKWAAAEHLHASDNDDIERLEMPPHVRELTDEPAASDERKTDT